MGNSPWPIDGARSHFGIIISTRHGWDPPKYWTSAAVEWCRSWWGQGRVGFFFWASIPWLSGWWLAPLWKNMSQLGVYIYIWNSQYVRSHQIPWFQTTNQLLMINSCWYHRWGCWWLPEIGEKSTASESASIPTSGICECSSTSTSLWNHIETTSKPHWNYHSTCIVSEGFFGHVDDVLWLHLQHLHPARFFV